MDTKVKTKLIVCLINLFSMGLVLFFPGTSTMASVFAILTLCVSGIFAEKVSNRKGGKDKVKRTVYYLTIAFVLLICAIVLSLTFSTQIKLYEESSKDYYILFNEGMAFLGGYQFKYLYFAIAAATIVLILEIAGFVKTFVISKTGSTWDEAAQDCIK